MYRNKKIFDRIVSKTKIYLAIIAILLVILCINNTRYIIPAIMIYALILWYAYWTNNKGEEELTEHIKTLTFSLDKIAKIALVNLPFPLIIADVKDNGNVVFRNTRFNEEFANIDINNYLKEIIDNIKIELKNSDKKEKIIEEIKIDKKSYKIYAEYMSLKDGYITIYFEDTTSLVKLEQKVDNENSYIGLIKIDNYDEIIQRISEEEKPQIVAKIEKSIYEWATIFNGLILKTERDTFVSIFEKRSIKQIEDKKFDILDSVKDESVFEKYQFTLSIAMSNEGKTNYEKYKSAVATLDIVLGRGGNQAVVREDDKYHFYGGRTQEVEKRTKVKARIVANTLEELIKESKNVIIMGHTKSDIDCIGSGIGIYKLAKTLNKEAYIIGEQYGSSLNNFIESLENENQYDGVMIGKDEAMEIIDSETLLVIVDTHKKTYVEIPELLEKTKKIVVIDHHRRSTDYIEEASLMFQEVYASSTAELVTEIVQYAEANVELTEFEAEALYAAIMMDTKAFTFKTGVRTFEAAAFLRKQGVDIIRVKKWFQSDLKTYNKISKIVGKADIVYNSIAISTYEEEDRDANIVCAKAADELLTINNITASFVIGMLDDKVYISGRSIGEINVQIILEKLRRWRTYNACWSSN